ncbi:hypothetical protein LGH83_04540 [Lichenihabitans sp. PAMC28606]|uniref:hypothetical protein n=1 Tax=Lichenihabitans sp. PAMC28606 TaxID=2880932 RepID=UPI001D09A953|nr:hypothetical protein [Lichenihabitans sp. PAMC28606]UDL95495.1 hypothetical protein LGH83_04540 [Lichenihabitans sp. PAMC28606]
MADRVSLSELARRLGRAKSGLHKLAAKGQIPRGADEKYDVDEVIAALKKNTDPARRSPVRDRSQPENSTENRKPQTENVDEAHAAIALIRRVLTEEGHEDVAVVDYNAARTAETILKARMRNLEVEEKAKTLISAAEAERTWADEMVKLRACMLAIAGDLPQVLQHLTAHDVSVIDRAIRDAMTKAAYDGP